MAMAMDSSGGESSTEMGDLLICPICLDIYKDPKTLGCLHSFCTGCLERCKKPYRREICCPVCKVTTTLSPQGVKGLRKDFRISQIRDLIGKQGLQRHGSLNLDDSNGKQDTKQCELCKAEQKKTIASHHCAQCSVFFCKVCEKKHEDNGLFAGHKVIDLTSSKATEVFFCKQHSEQPVKYFCKTCSSVLCTICIFTHSRDHTPFPLDTNVIEKYQKELGDALKSTRAMLSDVNCRTKYLETVKQGQQKALYNSQRAIRERTAEVISKIKEQEKQLLQSAQQQMEERTKDIGIDLLNELNFHKSNIEILQQDIENVLKGSPQDCLISYETLKNRTTAMQEANLPSVQVPRVNRVLKFVPGDSDLELCIGQLKECNVGPEELPDDISSTSLTGTKYCSIYAGGRPDSPPAVVQNRVNSILLALSSKRKNEVKIGKVKAFVSDAPRSPNAINADELITTVTASTEAANPVPSTSTSTGYTLDTPPASPSNDDNKMLLLKPKLVFKIDQIGGWPGKISSPTSIACLSDGTTLVAESDSRLQMFDRLGQSIRIIGWGKIRPFSVAMTPHKKIAITDRKDNCIKLFTTDGECVASWGQGLFNLPSGIASFTNGNFVITDADKHVVSIHAQDGTIITQFGAWGASDYQFNGPTYVAIGYQENIIISDSGNNCIKIYDHSGTFIRKVTYTSGSPNTLRKPQGVCTDTHSNIFVADRDNHRVCMFNRDGHFMRSILKKSDGIKYPCDVRVVNDDIFLVETHNGFLAKDPHHAIKKYQLFH